MTDSLQILPHAPEHDAAVLEIVREQVADLPAAGFSSEALAGEFSIVGVRGAVVGHCCVRSGILSVGVRSGHRGQKIGRVLVASALSWASFSGLEFLGAEVFETNEGALRFFDRLGFKEVHRHGPLVTLSRRLRPTTPHADRLVTFYGLERKKTPAQGLGACDYGLDADDLSSEQEEWDCLEAARWLREDEGRAQLLIQHREHRAGKKLEDSALPVEERRRDFLVGFRRAVPSRGAPPSAEQRAVYAAAADRLCELLSDRYERRHGEAPPAEALEAFRRGHDLWVPAMGDLGQVAADVEKFRDAHPRRWAQRALLKPKDPLAELRKLARWAATEMSKEAVDLG